MLRSSRLVAFVTHQAVDRRQRVMTGIGFRVRRGLLISELDVMLAWPPHSPGRSRRSGTPPARGNRDGDAVAGGDDLGVGEDCRNLSAVESAGAAGAAR